jgi:hypothetical protein
MPDIDEDIMRELMIQSTADLFARSAPTAEALRRRRQRQLRTRVLGVTGIAAAAGLAVGTLAIPSGAQPAAHPGVAAGSAGPAGATHAAQLTVAQQTLYGLSTAAAATQRPAGRYVVLAEKSVDNVPGGAGSETGPKTSVIDTVTGGGVTYQDITVSGGGVPQPPAVLNAPADSSPTTAQLDAMPTSTAGLRAFLLSQAKQQLNQAYAEMAQKAKKAGKKIATLIPKDPQPTDNDLVFEQAADLLWEPHLSSALRAAVYKVLADTPGVQVKSGVTDSAGRPAVEISRVASFSKEKVETFENPRTGATLESAWLEPTGEFMEDLYLSISYTNQIPGNPYQR